MIADDAVQEDDLDFAVTDQVEFDAFRALLASTTPGALVHWNKLAGIPADLADGDDDTTYKEGFGLELDGDRAFNVDLSEIQSRVSGVCAAGGSIRSIAADGAVTCEIDDNTTYTASGAIALSGTDFRLATTGCAAGEVWKYSGAAWTCEPDAAGGSELSRYCAAATADPQSYPAGPCGVVRVG